jgi:hypothetical protein
MRDTNTISRVSSCVTYMMYILGWTEGISYKTNSLFDNPNHDRKVFL